MYFPLSYGFLARGRWAVYCDDRFVGEVVRLNGSWYFRTFYEPLFVSQIPSGNRAGAVLQWPGLYDLCE